MYPTLSQFQRWASAYNVLPIWIEPQLPQGDFLEWAHNLIGGTTRTFLFHSAAAGPQGRYSYFALDTPPYTVHANQNELSIRYTGPAGARPDGIKIGNPVDRLAEWMAHFKAPRVDGLPPFWGGLVGHFSYGAARYVDPRLAELFDRKRIDESEEHFPDFELGLYDSVGVVDHFRRRLWLVHSVFLPQGNTLSPAQLERLYRSAQNRLRRQAVRLQRAIRAHRSWGQFETEKVKSNKSEAAYSLMVRRAKGFIEAGDIYQANLSQKFSGLWKGNPWMLYKRLTHINPSPYAALWRSGTRWIVSSSPELLVRQESTHLETRPIAGTTKRLRGALEEEHVRQFLKDTKENAEHVMLVDLERNDMSRVCAAPSVRVEESLTVEAYSHVFHLVSDIRGELAAGKTWRDVFQAIFPGGTITGCPKLRCMEIVDHLEKDPRGPYTGSLGWIGFSGDMTLNILIRSFFLTKDKIAFSVGAGIVADSVPEKEYQETLHKAGALLQALQEHQTLPLFPDSPYLP